MMKPRNDNIVTGGRVRWRPVLTESYVWCDVHGEVHRAEEDPHDEDMEDCNSDNWRAVYIAGLPGETFD